MFEIGDKVEVANILLQPYIESLGLHKISEAGIYVGFRDRGDYISVGGPVTRVGRKGEIRKHIDFSHDKRFDDNWYEVYLSTGLATYQWMNFHESELLLLARSNPMEHWLGSPQL